MGQRPHGHHPSSLSEQPRAHGAAFGVALPGHEGRDGPQQLQHGQAHPNGAKGPRAAGVGHPHGHHVAGGCSLLVKQGAQNERPEGKSAQAVQPFGGAHFDVALAKMPGGKHQKRPSRQERSPHEGCCKRGQAGQVGRHEAPGGGFGVPSEGVVVRDVVHRAMRKPDDDEQRSAQPPSPRRLVRQHRPQQRREGDCSRPKPAVAHPCQCVVHVEGLRERKGRKLGVPGPSQVTISVERVQVITCR